MANSYTTKTFDPKLYIITFLGIIITDFADGDFISISSEDGFESVQGADGSENRINMNKNGCDVDITVSQTSIINDIMTGFYNLDRLTNQGKGILLIQDLSGTTVFESSQAYIKKLPDTTAGNSLGTVTWPLRAPQAIRNVGGNL